MIDVDRLVSDLQERVAARAAAGGYDEGLLGTPFTLFSDAPVGTIVLRPEAAYSSKPVVGPVVTRIKRALISALFHFLNDAVSQANATLAASRRALETESNARATLETQVLHLTRELTEALARIDALERQGAVPGAPVAARTPIETRLVEPTPFPSRWDDPADPTERYDAYVAQIGSGPVLDLAPGDGAFLARCQAAGIPAQAGGDDPLAHLETLPAESLAGIAAIGLCDRLGASGSAKLAALAATRLHAGGALVVEIANPLTLAGRARRLRDPSLAPPLHPETLAQILRDAGFATVESRFLGVFPDAEGLPLENPPQDDLGARYNTIAHRVNRSLVGEPLVAIVARRAAAP